MLLLIGPKDVRPVVNRDFSRATIVARTRLSGSAEVGSFVRAVEAFGVQHFPRGIAVRATGALVLLGRSADALVWGDTTSLWQVMLVLLVVLSCLVRSLRAGLLSLIPIVLPTVALYGIMGWAGIPLDVSTSMIAAIALGLGIDGTIRLFTALGAAARRSSGNQAQAIAEVMGSVGQTLTLTNGALAAGFLIVGLSGFQPLRHFGILTAVVLTVGSVVQRLVTPALLAAAHGRSTR